MAVTSGHADWTENEVAVMTWAAVPNGNTGSVFSSGRMSDKCVQIIGTFGVAGSIDIEGSNDGTNWVILNGVTKGALTFTAAGLDQIIENPLFIRPKVTAGDGTTAITAIMACKGTH